MLDLWSFFDVLRNPKPKTQIEASKDFLYDEGLGTGTTIIGGPGFGKTYTLANHIFYYFKRHPREAIFILDWSGSITDCLFKLLLQDKDYQKLLKRIVYDDMGNTEWVVPFPEFSLEYGSMEEQVQRVSQNLQQLDPDLTHKTPILGGMALSDVAVNFFRLVGSITNDLGDNWQITETKKLIYNEALLKKALKRYGYKEPSAKDWFENFYLPTKQNEKYLSTKAIISSLGAIETPAIRARIGYYRAGWLVPKAIKDGSMVICDGAKLINQRKAQYYLFMQLYSMILQEINKRRPDNPNDQPASLVLDEVYSLLRIPSMADEIGRISTQYRSRKLRLYIVLQELAQMSDELREHIWSLGNLICFQIRNHDEAYEIAQQLFKYDPYSIKVAPIKEGQHPVMEPDRGQYLLYADWITSLGFRQCFMRRYIEQGVKEPKIKFVDRTYDFPNNKLYMDIEEAKEMLLKQRGVRVHDALKDINERNLKEENDRPEL